MTHLTNRFDLTKQGNMPEILAIEEFLKTLPQIDMPVTHYQIKGVYVRSLFIPADTLLTGRIHNAENIAILAQGTLRICNGTESQEITAPHIMVDQPGVKRLGYAVTDVTFITVHRTDHEDVETMEQVLSSETFEEFEQKRLESQS